MCNKRDPPLEAVTKSSVVCVFWTVKEEENHLPDNNVINDEKLIQYIRLVLHRTFQLSNNKIKDMVS